MTFLRDLARRHARVHPDDTAYLEGDRSRTWGELDGRSAALGAAFGDLGLVAGDRAGIIAEDHLELVDHWHACLRTGIVRTGINWRYAPAEMDHIVRDADLRLVVVQARFVPQLRDDLARWSAEGRAVIGFDDGHGLPLDLETLIAQALPLGEPVDLAPEDTVALSYTSGSTGLPKGALLTQEGGYTQVVCAPYAGGFRPDDVILNNLPGSGFPIFIHTYGMSSGAVTVLPGLFDPAATVRTIARHGVTIMFAVPTMVNAIEQAAAESGVELPTLRLVVILGSPWVPAVIERARHRFGCEFQNWYGSTEATGAVCMARPVDVARLSAAEQPPMTTVGRPLPHVDLEIRDSTDRPVPRGTTGEICVRGPVTKGYHNLPGETDEALRGGWLHLGDVGHQDEQGFVHLSDRKHFMIISGGYNVYPAVVENVLADHPGVSETAVVGAEHPRWGEAVVAVVVRAPGSTVTGQELVEHCAACVGRWEVPKHVEFVDALPLGSTGKIQKRDVRDWFRADPGRLPWAAPAPDSRRSPAATLDRGTGRLPSSSSTPT